MSNPWSAFVLIVLLVGASGCSGGGDRTVEQVAEDLGCGDLVLTSDPGQSDEESEYDCGKVKVIDFTTTGLSPDEVAEFAPFFATIEGEEVVFVEPLIFVVGEPADLPSA